MVETSDILLLDATALVKNLTVSEERKVFVKQVILHYKTDQKLGDTSYENAIAGTKRVLGLGEETRLEDVVPEKSLLSLFTGTTAKLTAMFTRKEGTGCKIKVIGCSSDDGNYICQYIIGK